ncbi:multifunctional CCA addition/repair protein [Methylicorpusculum sp.]|uniref:multifunctional CCA addition/repair protein n=1 Tax=Methylicorpusculum sp. TaxID=2713644 RepID=UPI00272F2EF8|nr:multifunctional CCA addition/repair protein [Methylicorpusculum sp.]MDP2178638.1 multifunctional CCA addition/repair protein [Methylicorpusculum sp.]MDP3529523.1 multifunctional CCA addition/repair protein [Methylicorpusculum sp.]MDZ4150028.1 multifunctional CCA addition/repair protein [Methylicorpusculum sp.]
MKTFLVGGAVRDELLNFPVSERDWVVLGETPESMLAMGFMTVGKDFPVFLHPITRDEYALARTERKIGPGYKGFCIHADPEVSLEEDLLRRDLTINAIAKSDTGEIIDPFGGRQDLDQRIFRHISPAFCEDPVRILRIARFAARYGHLGFKIADETLALMQTMVKNGEVDHLVPERVWAELYKALCEKTPTLFFEVLKDCYALQILFPELNTLFGVPQPEHYHPEIDTGIHSLMCLEQAARLTPKPEVRFAALMHDLGKGITPKDRLPHHHGHEHSGLPLLENLCLRLRVPNPFKQLAKQVMQYHTHCHRVFELRPSTLTDMLHRLGAFKNPAGLTDFLLACEADAKGRTGLENRPYPQAAHVMMAAEAGASVDISAVLTGSLQGTQIGDAIRQLRIKAISDACKRTS